MKREDIAQAFHLTAMGRANHPLQVELIDALEKLLSRPAEAEGTSLPVIEIEIDKPKKAKAK